jgi:hypothetical protein
MTTGEFILPKEDIKHQGFVMHLSLIPDIEHPYSGEI